MHKSSFNICAEKCSPLFTQCSITKGYISTRLNNLFSTYCTIISLKWLHLNSMLYRRTYTKILCRYLQWNFIKVTLDIVFLFYYLICHYECMQCLHVLLGNKSKVFPKWRFLTVAVALACIYQAFHCYITYKTCFKKFNRSTILFYYIEKWKQGGLT